MNRFGGMDGVHLGDLNQLERIKMVSKEFTRYTTISKYTAAVLVVLFLKNNDWHVLLTVRSANLSKHAGEVAFPGGKQDSADFSIKETALREANEEVNLKSDDVEIVGCFEPIVTRFGMEVHPVIGFVKSSDNIQRLIPNEDEVASIFSVPLRQFLFSERLSVKNFTLNGYPYAILEFELDSDSVSGITALVLVRTAQVLFDQSPTFYYRYPTDYSKYFQSLSSQNKL